jgi:integrase
MFQRQRKPLPEQLPTQLELFNSDCINGGNGSGHSDWPETKLNFWTNLSKFQNRLVALSVGAKMKRDKRIYLRDAFVLVHSLIESSYPGPTGTARKLHGLLIHFEKDLQAHGLEFLDEITADHVLEHMWSARKTKQGYAEVSPRTAGNRQWAYRIFQAAMGSEGFNDGFDLSGDTVSRGEPESPRPLNLLELDSVVGMVDSTLISTGEDVLVALSMSGATASEAGLVRVCDVDLDNSVVHLQGENPRTAMLSDWACNRIALFLSENRRDSEHRLAVADFVATENVARTVNTRLMNVMRMTGFRSGSGVTAKSIRLGAATVVLESQGLEAAALFLGNNSLDATARMLRYEWWVTR